MLKVRFDNLIDALQGARLLNYHFQTIIFLHACNADKFLYYELPS